MNDEIPMPSDPSPPQAEPTPEETVPPSDPPPTSRTLSPEERQQILDVYHRCRAIRRTAGAVGRDRKTVRRVLEEAGVRITPPGHSPPDRASKLDPFRETIREKAAQRLTLTRVLREIREQGYKGSRTILADHVRTLPSTPAPAMAKRRFETPPGHELQVDWSVFTVTIAGVLCCVHALGCVLAYSRYLHLRFYRDERQSTLLEGLARAFEALGGVALRLVFDNMATVVLGRVGKNRTVLWHPRLLDFARHYAFEPFACRVRHPDRKGKDERVFDYLEKDLLRGSSFASFEDLNLRAETWTTTIANRRVHGTTRRVPAEALLAERDFLVRLPETRFGVHEDSMRQVGPDATVSIAGTLYTVPHHLAGRCVAVRLYAEHFEVLDRQGRVALSRRYVADEDKGKLQIDPTHYLGLPHGPRGGGGGGGGGGEGGSGTSALDQALLKRFPSLAPLVEGITVRMKSLAHIHLKALWRLAETHRDAYFLAAATRAQDYRRYSAQAVGRILDQIDPLPNEPLLPVDAATRARATLGEVDPGSLDQYGHLDNATPSEPPSDPNHSSERETLTREDSDEDA
jgi:transposase